MKILLLFMAIMLAVVKANDFFLRGDYSSNEQDLIPLEDDATLIRNLDGNGGMDEKDFAKISVTYRSKEKKCVLTYRVKGKPKQTIEFHDIEEKDDGSAVTCKQRNVEKTEGITFPVEARGFEAVWKEPNGKEITDFEKTKWKWTADEKTYVYLEREKMPPKDPMDEDDFEFIKAEYDSKNNKCKLTYQVEGTTIKPVIEYDKIEESSDGTYVKCTQRGLKPTEGIHLPVYANDFDAVWKEKGGDTTEFKETKWKWEKNRVSTLYLKREKKEPPKEPMDEDDFEFIKAEYDSKNNKCKLTYQVEGTTIKPVIEYDKIEESSDGTYVKCTQRDLKPTEGIHLPVYANDFDAVWKEKGGDTTKFKETKWKWEKNRVSTLYLKREKKEPPKEPMDEDDFAKIYAEYDSTKDKCKLTYRVHKQARATIYFNKIDESSDGRYVTCKRNFLEPTDGIHLPVHANDFEAIWKDKYGETTEFKKTTWKWEKDKKSTTLYLERNKKDPPKEPMDEDDFKRLIARYRSKEKRCSLTYKVHGERKETIWFNTIDESDNGRTVTCTGKESPTSGVWLPVKADDFDAIWKERGGKNIEVEKSMLRWNKDKNIRLTLKREPGGTDEDDFKTLQVVYSAKNRRCKLIYQTYGGPKKYVWLNDHVRENKKGNMVVCREYDVKPPKGVSLPVKANDVDAKWYNYKGVSQDVENAKVIWDKGNDIKATIYLDDNY